MLNNLHTNKEAWSDLNNTVLVLFILYIFFMLLAPYIVYINAKHKKRSDAWFWAMVTFLFPIVGLFLYFVLSKSFEPIESTELLPIRKKKGS